MVEEEEVGGEDLQEWVVSLHVGGDHRGPAAQLTPVPPALLNHCYAAAQERPTHPNTDDGGGRGGGPVLRWQPQALHVPPSHTSTLPHLLCSR